MAVTQATIDEVKANQAKLDNFIRRYGKHPEELGLFVPLKVLRVGGNPQEGFDYIWINYNRVVTNQPNVGLESGVIAFYKGRKAKLTDLFTKQIWEVDCKVCGTADDHAALIEIDLKKLPKNFPGASKLLSWHDHGCFHPFWESNNPHIVRVQAKKSK